MTDQFGGLPPAPRAPEGSTAPHRGERPSSVVTAVRLMLLTAALNLIGIIVALVTKDDLRKRIQDKNPNADQQRLDSLVNTALTVAIVIAVVFLALYVALAFQVLKGKNWARIVTWVFAGLGVIGALGSLATAATPFARIIGVVGGVVDVAVIVLLAQAASNRYFKPRYT